MGRQLTYRQAVKVARIGLSTVQRWRREGMPMGTDERGRRTVDIDVLFRWKRDKLRANPVLHRTERPPDVGVSQLTRSR